MSAKHENHYQNIKITKLPNSEVSIEGELTVHALEHHKDHALAHFKEEIELPGFRKGHVPEKMILERVGKLAIWEEAGEHAIRDAYPEIVEEFKLQPISRPEVAFTKLAIGSPLSFTIKIAVFPELELAKYKDIAVSENKKKENVDVSEKEVNDAILEIRRMREGKEKGAETEEKDLPPLNDEMVKEFGNFKDIADFKAKVEEGLKKEKELRAKEKNRLSIIKEIIKGSKIEVPEILVEDELSRMLAQMSDDVSRMGLKMADYLKHIKKTEDDLKKDWRNDAVERVKMELILQKIAEEEKIEAPKEEIEVEVKHLLEHYQDADPLRAGAYFTHIIKNEKVFQFLENQK